MPMLVCPACESSNGHSFSCPLLTADDHILDPAYENMRAFYASGEHLYDESDDLEFYGFDTEESEREWTDEDEAGLEEWEIRRRERIAESNEY